MPVEVVLMGKGSLAVRAAQWLLETPQFELSCLVPTIPEPTWTDSLVDWGRGHGIPHVASGDFRDLAAFREGRRTPLAISIFYDKIITAEFIDSCDRIVNVHNGPLPRYRGVSPINW